MINVIAIDDLEQLLNKLDGIINALPGGGGGGGSVVNYSTTEVNTGMKWIDNKPVYQCVFTGDVNGSANYNIPGSDVIDTLISVEASVNNGTAVQRVLPYRPGSTSYQYVHKTASGLFVSSDSTSANNYKYYIVVARYTKV